MIMARPDLLHNRIGLFFQQAERLAPWWEFYNEVVDRPFPSYTDTCPLGGNPRFPHLLVVWGIQNAGEAAKIAEKVGFIITMDDSVGALEKVSIRHYSSRTYIAWAEKEWKTLGDVTVKESLYHFHTGIEHTDLTETLLLLAQHRFYTGELWNPADRIVCHAFRHTYQSYRFRDRVPTLQLRTEDPEHPEIHISTVGINEHDESLKAICLRAD
jgi:hypothetical protein